MKLRVAVAGTISAIAVNLVHGLSHNVDVFSDTSPRIEYDRRTTTEKANFDHILSAKNRLMRYFMPEMAKDTMSSLYSGSQAGDETADVLWDEEREPLPYPNMSFEGINQVDQLRATKTTRTPPSAVTDVGPDHLVQVVNSAYAVYDKQGKLLKPASPIRDLFKNFPIQECELLGTFGYFDAPTVLYDQFEDRWLLAQHTTGCLGEAVPCYFCISISKTGDPTGDYYRYAVETPIDDRPPPECDANNPIDSNSAPPFPCNQILTGSTMDQDPGFLALQYCGTTGDPSGSVYYSFTAEEEGSVVLSTCSDFETKVQVWLDCGTPGSEQCVDGDAFLNSSCDSPSLEPPVVSFNVTAGATYIIRVFGADDEDEGDFELSIVCSDTSLPPPPPPSYAFPILPRFGLWSNSYIITTMYLKDFSFLVYLPNGVGVYALEKSEMISGSPNARVKQIILQENGDNDADARLGEFFWMLPPDIEGNTLPPEGSPAPLITKQDDDWGLPMDALNIWELEVDWEADTAEVMFKESLPVKPVNSNFAKPIPQPGANPSPWFFSLEFALQPRFAYRRFGCDESMVVVTADLSEAGFLGKRWYQIRRSFWEHHGEYYSEYNIHQQGTFSPDDGTHRWQGSIAQDRAGNIAMGYSVVNGIDVFLGIRYTARLMDDPLDEMTLGEGVIARGSGIQALGLVQFRFVSSMNVDPADDCTFWYTNSYYTSLGEFAGEEADDGVFYQTRIASFILPGCVESYHSSTSKSACSGDDYGGWRRRLGKGL